MYATWIGFALITDEWNKVDEIAYDAVTIARFTIMSSPSLGLPAVANGYWNTGKTQGGINGGGNVWYGQGARPALYH